MLTRDSRATILCSKWSQFSWKAWIEIIRRQRTEMAIFIRNVKTIPEKQQSMGTRLRYAENVSIVRREVDNPSNYWGGGVERMRIVKVRKQIPNYGVRKSVSVFDTSLYPPVPVPPRYGIP